MYSVPDCLFTNTDTFLCIGNYVRVLPTLLISGIEAKTKMEYVLYSDWNDGDKLFYEQVDMRGAPYSYNLFVSKKLHLPSIVH